MAALLELLKAGELHVYEIGHWPDPLFSVTVRAKSEQEARDYCWKTHGFGGPLCVDMTAVWIRSLKRAEAIRVLKGESSSECPSCRCRVDGTWMN